MEVLASEPDFGRALHLEALGAGEAALERRARIFARFSERTRRAHEQARREDPSRPPLPEAAFEFRTGGIDELVRECLRTRGAEPLPELVEPAVETTMRLLDD